MAAFALSIALDVAVAFGLAAAIVSGLRPRDALALVPAKAPLGSRAPRRRAHSA